jgi:hypothetical protein
LQNLTSPEQDCQEVLPGECEWEQKEKRVEERKGKKRGEERRGGDERREEKMKIGGKRKKRNLT